MAVTKTMLTLAGLKKYEDELHELKVVRRQEVAQKIKVAREQGDLSENADYDAAKDEQSEIERRILELEQILKNAEVVVDEDFDADKINVGCTVTIRETSRGMEATYHLVGSSEADSRQKKISNESPVGAALMGHRKGDMVEVQLPSGAVMNYEIMDVKKMDEAA
ncbi:MAG TPA: transcription elongation factor GreA [Candidatus Avilachnospira avistercoris]|nr:transcription elongation factor GreA [Candidatus Avilachnospira avistercoris]